MRRHSGVNLRHQKREPGRYLRPDPNISAATNYPVSKIIDLTPLSTAAPNLLSP
jgi:hypothetical protein